MEAGTAAGRAAHAECILEGRHITKSYLTNHITACDDVTIRIQRGEVHTIVGENGAGKSTLMRILSGSQQPDSGTILVEGRETSLETPHKALELGIGMVHQQSNIIPELTVLQNMILGAEQQPWTFLPVHYRKLQKEIEAIAETYSISCPYRKKASVLDGSGIQTASLLALLFRDAELIIFDEPHALFSGPESRQLSGIVRDLKAHGKTVSVITHNMESALEISDHITIMQRGRSLGTFAPRELTAQSITTMMMGFEDISSTVPSLSSDESAAAGLRESGSVQLRLDHVSAVSVSHASPLRDISFTVSSGEILACIGIKEQGIFTLEHLLANYYPHETVQPPLLTEGAIEYGGGLPPRTPHAEPAGLKELREAGAGYIPSNRLRAGVSVSGTVFENGILNHLDDLSADRLGVGLDRKKSAALVQRLIHAFSIKAEPHDPVLSLSGGNIQKLIAAREIERKPRLLIASEVSWGLDVMTQEHMFHILEQIKYAGCGILLITSEADIALKYADRIALFHKGSIVATVPNRNLTKETIGAAILRGAVPPGTGNKPFSPADTGSGQRKSLQALRGSTAADREDTEA